jgi:c-di-GMP-binding flagellar brake protein YcgR
VGQPAQIQVIGRPGWERVILVDISEGGSGIQAAAELPLQSEIRLRFTLPSYDRTAAELEASGLVVRAARGPRADEELPVRLGLLFLSFSGEGLDTVRRWIWSSLK